MTRRRPIPGRLRHSNGCWRCAICGPAARKGFISVLAGFSFLGILLGVFTLITVMAVMNGFRKELFDKILGSTATSWSTSRRRRLRATTPRSRSAWPWCPASSTSLPLIEGQAMASTPAQARGRLRARHQRGWAQGAAADRGQRPLAAPSTASTSRKASPSARGWPTRCASTSATPSRWSRRAAPARRSAPRRASSPTRWWRSSRWACPSTTAP